MTQIFRSYLFAYLMVLGVPLGCLGLLLLHSLVGGEWGKAIRPILQAGADTMPGVALLFVPILLGLRHIYTWMNHVDLMNESFSAGHKHIYFNVLFFVLRAVLYFTLWSWMAARQRMTPRGAALSLLIYVFTVSFASFDWVMSLEPQWSSSIYGAMLMIGDVLSGLAFSVLVLNRNSRNRDGPSKVTEDAAQDLGNLLLTFVMMWAYMGLSQYLIIWSGNLPEEIGWYLARQRGGWQAVAILLVLFQFVLPFLLLLARQRKRKLATLARVAGLILALRVIDVFWLTVPDFSPGRFSLHVFDVLALVGLGGVWLLAFRNRLEREGGA